MEWVRASLPGREIVWLDSAASTMTEATRLAASGCPEGTVVVAEEQTAGRGRHGRKWHSERETGLYVSIVLRPGGRNRSLQVLTLALGLAVQESIESATGVRCDLHWPNDVYACGRKCAGVLVRAAGAAVIVGIGINVNQRAFPPELPAATSLRLASGREHSREAVLAELVRLVDRYAGLLASQGDGAIIQLYTRRAHKEGSHAAGAGRG